MDGRTEAVVSTGSPLPAALASPRDEVRGQVLSYIPDLLRQKLWVEISDLCFYLFIYLLLLLLLFGSTGV
jgi:hypothetical protein